MWSLWRIYLFRIFRVSFTEPVSRGIGWLNLFGFILGAFAILIVTSTMSGFFTSIHTAVATYSGDLSVLSYRSVSQKDVDRIRGLLETRYQVRGKTVLFKTLPVLISYAGKQADGFLEAPISTIETGYPKSTHACLTRSDRPSVVLGSPIQRKLNVRKGDHVTLFFVLPNGVQKHIFEVCGFSDVGYYAYDKHLVWATSHALNQLDTPIGAKIRIPYDTFKDLRQEQYQLASLLDNPFSVFTWYDRNRNLFEAIQTEKALIVIVLIFIILVASFNLISHLYVHYNQRREVFQLLYVLGERKWRMMILTMIQGSALGLLGSGIGVALAWGVIQLIKGPLPIPIPVSIYNLSTLPVQFDWYVATWVIFGSGGIAMLVSVIPAIRTRFLFRIQSLSS